MDYRIKSLSLPSRNKIKLDNLNALLNQNKLPQTNKDQSIVFRTTQASAVQPSYKLLLNKTKSYDSFAKFSQTWKQFKYENGQSSSLKNNGKLFRSNELNKSHHRFLSNRQKYSSIQQQYLKSQQLRNAMWTPILNANHHSPSKNNINKKQATQNPQKQASQKKKLQFLKKGTDINKRVVINLLKLKVTRQLKNVENEAEKIIKNQQICKMIKICKGYGQTQTVLSSFKKKGIASKRQQKQKKQIKLSLIKFGNINMQLPITSWQNPKKSIYTENHQIQ